MPRPAMTAEAFDSTRSRLLSATARIIAGEGYAAFSMRRLGQEVGLTAGALYRYFPTRQHVLVAYWREALEELNRRVAETAATTPSVDDRLVGMLLAYADFALEDRDRFRVLFIENDLGAHTEHEEREDLLAAYRNFSECVGEAIAAGVLLPMPVDVATNVLWGAVHGVLTLAATVAELEFGDVRALARTAVSATLRGLRPEENAHAKA